MPLHLLEHPVASLVQGHGLDLPGQAARVRAQWVAGRQGRPPVLLAALLWARHCPDVVHVLNRYLDILFADYRCTPQGWSEAQAARQVLAALNLQLYRRRRAGEAIPEFCAGLLLVQGEQAQFFQAGAIGLLRYRDGALQSLVGREEQALGSQAELALVQHSLPLTPGEVLLVAPQPLLAVTDQQAFCQGCRQVRVDQLSALLEPWLGAPGAALILRPGEAETSSATLTPEQWPAVVQAAPGLQLDGWTLLGECAYGPAQRLFRAEDVQGRPALLWLAEQAADEVFWQREWVLRRSPVASLPQVLSTWAPRRHAFLLFEAPAPGMRSLADWAAAHGPLDADSLLGLLGQLIEAVRALQRRGMQGLLLSPRQILIGEDGRLLLLPEYAAQLPGVGRQLLPAEAVPLAPELRGAGELDGRADQFALAALSYWLLCGHWPEVARRVVGWEGRYVPLATFTARLPLGWDGVLARALAPRPSARFDALSEFQLALEQPVEQARARPVAAYHSSRERMTVLALLSVPLALGLWLGFGGG
ncbi:MAG: protein kinase [Pseudomonadota bacterium]